jgi:transposase
MGLEKKLELWKKPKPIHRTLRGLTRESSQLQEKITVVKNEMEAENFRQDDNKSHIKRLKSELSFLSKLKKEVEAEIKSLIKSDEFLNAKIEKLTSVKGLGIKTVACVVAETDGFSQTHNKRQLASYAGYDVINQESGTSVNTKAKISKRGNKHIRKAMHMAALSSVRHGGNKDLYVRIVGKTGIKMKGVVAAQRKLLILMYTLWKNDTVYDPDYEAKKRGDFTPPLELDLVRS